MFFWDSVNKGCGHKAANHCIGPVVQPEENSELKKKKSQDTGSRQLKHISKE